MTDVIKDSVNNLEIQLRKQSHLYVASFIHVSLRKFALNKYHTRNLRKYIILKSMNSSKAINWILITKLEDISFWSTTWYSM